MLRFCFVAGVAVNGFCSSLMAASNQLMSLDFLVVVFFFVTGGAGGNLPMICLAECDAGKSRSRMPNSCLAFTGSLAWWYESAIQSWASSRSVERMLSCLRM